MIAVLAPGAQNDFGLDLYSEPAEVLRSLRGGETANVRLDKGSVLAMPYPAESMDCVVCFSVLEHIREIAEAAREIRRVLKSSGRLIVGMPSVNLFMDAAFRAIGFSDIRRHHVTTPDAMKRAFGPHFGQERCVRMRLAGVPLYHVFLFTAKALKGTP